MQKLFSGNYFHGNFFDKNKANYGINLSMEVKSLFIFPMFNF